MSLYCQSLETLPVTLRLQKIIDLGLKSKEKMKRLSAAHRHVWLLLPEIRSWSRVPRLTHSALGDLGSKPRATQPDA